MTATQLQQIGTVTAYELRKYLRGRRLTGMLILAVAVVGLILALPPLLGTEYPTDPNAFASQFAQFSSILVVLCAVLFAADALCGEHEKRTAYFLFPNPVRREGIVVGKLVASLVASGLVLTLYYASTILSTWAVTEGVTEEIWLSYGYTLIYVLAVVGVAYIISSVFKRTITSAVFTFFLFMMIFSILQQVLLLGDIEPWFLPSVAGGIISDVLGGGAGVVHGPTGPVFATYVPEVDVALAVMGLYFLIGSVLAILLFRRRELVS